MIVSSADRCLHATRKSEQRTCPAWNLQCFSFVGFWVFRRRQYIINISFYCNFILTTSSLYSRGWFARISSYRKWSIFNPQAPKVGVFLVWHKPPQIWNGSWPSSSGLRGHRILWPLPRCRRTYLTILERRTWSANFKMVWFVLLRSWSWSLSWLPTTSCSGSV
jgi:hypothetical protein